MELENKCRTHRVFADVEAPQGEGPRCSAGSSRNSGLREQGSPAQPSFCSASGEGEAEIRDVEKNEGRLVAWGQKGMIAATSCQWWLKQDIRENIQTNQWVTVYLPEGTVEW